MKVLTVSVAAYNVESYLPKLMESLNASNVMDAIEVLIVNDGSTDGTAALAEGYVQQYPNSVKLVNKENGGHGSTINKGMELATGKYFKVIDGDDWVVPSGLARLTAALREANADLVFTDYDMVYENGAPTRTVTLDVPAWTALDLNEHIARIGRMAFHGMYYKTSVLQDNNIRITEKCFYVDTQYVLFPLPYIRTFLYCDFPVYCYRLGREGQSVSWQGMLKHEAEHDTVVKTNMAFYLEHKNDMSADLCEYFEEHISGLSLTSLYLKFFRKMSLKNMRAAIAFDDCIKAQASIYRRGRKNKTLDAWRKSRMLLYVPTWLWLNHKERTTEGK